MSLDMGLAVVALGRVLIGAGFCLTATIGLLRWPDVPSRLHAATKPQVLGVLLIVGSCEWPGASPAQRWVARVRRDRAAQEGRVLPGRDQIGREPDDAARQPIVARHLDAG